VIISSTADQLASLGICAQLTRCFSAVAELLVIILAHKHYGKFAIG